MAWYRLLVHVQSFLEEGKDVFLWLPASFGKSVRYEVLSIVCLTVNKANQVQGGGSYAIICQYCRQDHLRLPNFNDVSVLFCCSSFFSFVCVLLSNILSIYYCTWTMYINITILQKYSRSKHTCASGQYQACLSTPTQPGYEAKHQQYTPCSCNHGKYIAESGLSMLKYSLIPRPSHHSGCCYMQEQRGKAWSISLRE